MHVSERVSTRVIHVEVFNQTETNLMDSCLITFPNSFRKMFRACRLDFREERLQNPAKTHLPFNFVQTDMDY